MKVISPKNSNDTVDYSVLKLLRMFFTQTNTKYYEAAYQNH